MLLLLISGGGRRHPDHGWDEMGVEGEMKMMWSRWWPGRRQPTAGVKVMKKRPRSRSAVGAGRWTVGALPGTERSGGVPSTYRPGPGPWDEWDSWRGGPPCGRWSGIRGRRGLRPSLRNDGRTGALSSGRNGAGRGRCGRTVGAVVRLVQLEASEEALFHHAPRRWGVVTSNSHSPSL